MRSRPSTSRVADASLSVRGNRTQRKQCREDFLGIRIGKTSCRYRFLPHTQAISHEDCPIELLDGAVTSGPDLSLEVNGLRFPNPFITGSGPPGTNYAVMRKAFQEGWGGVIAKTVSLDSSKVVNVTPRYAKMRASQNREVIAWENIELISDRSLEVMLEDFARLKAEFPDRVLIASIMEEYDRASWEELIARCEDAGVDAFEINFSCPHGMPERRMGAAMGQDCAILEEVCGWIRAATTRPVWAKMTPNITDITAPARTALAGGCDGIAAINTINCIMGINLQSLRPEPSVEGYSTPGGYSSTAVKPIALAKVAAIASMIKRDFSGSSTSLSGIGGVNTGSDGAEFILLGADTVQVCSGIMMHGYPMIKHLCGGLQAFMKHHGFTKLTDFKGASLPYMTTHMELVRLQQEAIERKKKKVGLTNDKEWSGEDFVQQSESMVAN